MLNAKQFTCSAHFFSDQSPFLTLTLRFSRFFVLSHLPEKHLHIAGGLVVRVEGFLGNPDCLKLTFFIKILLGMWTNIHVDRIVLVQCCFQFPDVIAKEEVKFANGGKHLDNHHERAAHQGDELEQIFQTTDHLCF